MKKLRKIRQRFSKKKDEMKAQFKPSMPSSPFGIPEDVYSILQQIHLALTGSSYPNYIVNDDTIQELLVNIENHVGIGSSFSVGAFSIPEDVRDRLRTLYQIICGTSYSQCSAVPEDLYKILEDILFTSSIYGHWKFNDGVGLTATDSSWRSNDGTLVNMIDANWIVGKVGSNALNFILASTQYVDAGNYAGFERTDPFSIECWAKTIGAGLYHLVSKMENADPFRGWALRINAGKIEFILSSKFNDPGQSLLRIRTVNNFNDGTWHHLVVSYPGNSFASGVKIYVDEVSQALVTVVDNLSGTILNAINLNFGSRAGGAWGFNGDLDEIVIWTKELTQEEVSYRYNSGIGRENFEIN